MKWKRLDINILSKSDAEIISMINTARVGGFAQSVKELKKYIFIAEIFWHKLSENPKEFIRQFILYTRGNEIS